MNLKHNQRTPKGVTTRFEMGQQTTKLKRYIISQSEEFLVREKNILVSLTGLGSSRTAHQDVTKTTNDISN